MIRLQGWTEENHNPAPLDTYQELEPFLIFDNQRNDLCLLLIVRTESPAACLFLLLFPCMECAAHHCLGVSVPHHLMDGDGIRQLFQLLLGQLDGQGVDILLEVVNALQSRCTNLAVLLFATRLPQANLSRSSVERRNT